ncbi:hypothetical protein [Streptomyces sp. NBC_00557]|uniref:hypothetical protein n=1 Tax=Streptomyces sp. NBC_00557 TaxID=2975776 RepID=UPI002E810907|nr:hypothetical protein [Streptomyces sp. NBC_00557]WUC40132.1 hypothetical protein OG956_36715 [Streptomyces sp. NBC_00557]
MVTQRALRERWLGYLEAGAGEPGQEIVMFGFEVVGPGEEHAGDDVALLALRLPPAGTGRR